MMETVAARCWAHRSQCVHGVHAGCKDLHIGIKRQPCCTHLQVAAARAWILVSPRSMISVVQLHNRHPEGKRTFRGEGAAAIGHQAHKRLQALGVVV